MSAHVDPAGSYGVPAPTRLECVIAHDQPAVVHAASAYLRQRGISVIPAARTGPEILETIRAYTPALALIDLGSDTELGPDVVRSMTADSPVTGVIVYTRGGGRVVLDALAAGARGVLRRNALIADLAQAIDTVLAGGVYIDAALARALTSGAGQRTVAPLTEREREVLSLLANGMTYSQVAERLDLRTGTVETHVRNAVRRLGAKSRTEAVAIALRLELIE